MAEHVELRELVDLERVNALERLRTLEAEHDSIVTSSIDSNADDEHDPEGSTIAFEREQLAARLLEARKYLRDIDEATARIAEGSYGNCERCGAPITMERLRARPTAKTCIRCAAAS